MTTHTPRETSRDFRGFLPGRELGEGACAGEVRLAWVVVRGDVF